MISGKTYDSTTMEDVVNGLHKLFIHLGLQDSCSAILKTLILSNKPLSVKDLIRLTGYSKSTISTCLSTLEHLDLINKTKINRYYIYGVTNNLIEYFIEKQRKFLTKTVIPLQNKIRHILQAEKLDDSLKMILENLYAQLSVLNKYLNLLIRQHHKDQRR